MRVSHMYIKENNQNGNEDKELLFISKDNIRYLVWTTFIKQFKLNYKISDAKFTELNRDYFKLEGQELLELKEFLYFKNKLNLISHYASSTLIVPMTTIENILQTTRGKTNQALKLVYEGYKNRKIFELDSELEEKKA